MIEHGLGESKSLGVFFLLVLLTLLVIHESRA
jgi:hypothetical protein